MVNIHDNDGNEFHHQAVLTFISSYLTCIYTKLGDPKKSSAVSSSIKCTIKEKFSKLK